MYVVWMVLVLVCGAPLAGFLYYCVWQALVE